MLDSPVISIGLTLPGPSKLQKGVILAKPYHCQLAAHKIPCIDLKCMPLWFESQAFESTADSHVWLLN